MIVATLLFLLCPAAQDFKAEVRLVDVAFTARDASGNLVTDLRKDEIEVSEDGVPQKIEAFLQSLAVPLSLGLVMDASGSQSSFVKRHRKDLRTFLRTVLSPKDKAFLVGFATRVRLISDFENDEDTLLDRFEEYDKKPGSKPEIGPFVKRSLGTGFYDAIYLSIREKLAKADRGRSALIVFSDGEDNASQYHLLDVIQTAQTEDVVLFSIHYAPKVKGEPEARNLYGVRVMERIAADTGGSYFTAENRDLRPVFEEIEQTLRSSYELAYRTTNLEADGTFRKIKIRCTRPGVKIRHRSGYYPRVP
jgi:Ca-activated chloride channel homolog